MLKRTIFNIIGLLVLAAPLFAAAQACRSNAAGFCFNLASVAESVATGRASFAATAVSTLGDLIENIYVFGLGLVGVAALVMLIFGGLKYMTAADNPSQVQSAKDAIWNAILGLVIALIAWLMLNTINPDLVKKLQLSLDEIKSVQCTGGLIWCEPLSNCTTENQCVGQGFGVQCSCPSGLTCVQGSCPSGCNPTGNQCNTSPPPPPNCSGLACPGGVTPSCQCASGTTPTCVSETMQCQSPATAICGNVPATQRACTSSGAPNCSCTDGRPPICGNPPQRIWTCL